MKKILFIFIGILLCGNNCFALDCSRADPKVLEMYDNFFNDNKDKQISGDAFKQLDEQGKREAKLRNLCFGASVDWHYWCGYSYCERCEGEGRKRKCNPVDKDMVFIHDHTFNEFCALAEIDCFTEDIDKIYEILQKETDPFTQMFLFDMNRVVNDILNGKAELAIIDINKQVCYETDDNGDTVWHAFARSKYDSWGWQDLCVSVNKQIDPFEMLATALYKTKNNKGRTAVQDAIDSGTPSSIFGFFWMYARQERENYCDFLPQDISQTNNIDIAIVKSLLKCP